MRIYISGPVTGMPDWNAPAFEAAEAALAAAGYEPVNPLRHTEPHWGYNRQLKEAIRAMMRCDALALLPGYLDSNGSTVELWLAGQVGMEARELEGWL